MIGVLIRQKTALRVPMRAPRIGISRGRTQYIPQRTHGAAPHVVVALRHAATPTPYAALRELISEVDLPESHTILLLLWRFEL